MVHSDRVYGRKPVIRLVRELMAREETGGSLRSQRFPILVVEGFRGAGKTALLSTLDDLLDQRVPYARLDFEANRHASVPQVLSALAFELSRKCPRYGVLQFPRFIILKWLTTRAPRRIVLGSFQDWYGHRDWGLTNDSVDVLVDLSRWAGNTEDEDAQQRVD